MTTNNNFDTKKRNFIEIRYIDSTNTCMTGTKESRIDRILHENILGQRSNEAVETTRKCRYCLRDPLISICTTNSVAKLNNSK